MVFLRSFILIATVLLVAILATLSLSRSAHSWAQIALTDWFEYHHYVDILNTQVVIFCEEKILIWDKNLNSFQKNSSTKPLKLSLKPTSFCYLSWTRNVDSFRYFWKLHTFSTTFVLFFTTEKHIQNIHENNGKYV